MLNKPNKHKFIIEITGCLFIYPTAVIAKVLATVSVAEDNKILKTIPPSKIDGTNIAVIKIPISKTSVAIAIIVKIFFTSFASIIPLLFGIIPLNFLFNN